MSSQLSREAYNQINWSNLVKKNTKMLNKCKILQRNVIFITGIPKDIENEELLKSSSYFGQYGVIKNIIINKTIIKKGLTPDPDTFAAYITYIDIFSACYAYICLSACNIPDMPNLNISFATTKFCKFFLKHTPCELKACSFYHNPCYFEDLIDMEKYNSYQMQDLFKDIAINYIKANKSRLFAKTINTSQASILPTPDDCDILKEILNEPIIEEDSTTLEKKWNISPSSNRNYNYRRRARTSPDSSIFNQNCGAVQLALPVQNEIAWNNIPEAYEQNCNLSTVNMSNYANQYIYNPITNYSKHQFNNTIMEISIGYIGNNIYSTNFDHPIYESQNDSHSITNSLIEKNSVVTHGNSQETLLTFTESNVDNNSKFHIKKPISISSNKKKASSEAFNIYKQNNISKE